MVDSKSAHERIRENIQSSGMHVYVVRSSEVPRFGYSIGLSEQLGYELIFAGGVYFSYRHVGDIMNSLRQQLTVDGDTTRSFSLGQHGRFTLRKVQKTWVEALLLGAIDYYGSEDLSAYQIVPEPTRHTADIPRLDRPCSPKDSPGWRWVFEHWDHDVPIQSTATTNLQALQGETVTEVVRWEDDYWEMFAGPGPDVDEADIRIVPLGCMVEIDPSLASSLLLKPGSGHWRHAGTDEWNAWT